VSDQPQGDLSHTRPSRATDTLTEGDLLFGRGMTAVATLVERQSRYLMLIALPDGHRAELVADAVAAELNGRPRQTLRWMKPSEALDLALR
jgi:IS30 family transposase